MRIATAHAYDASVENLQKRQVEMAQSQAQLTSGKRVLRASDFTKPAWSVYKFSLLYLALLFAAMVVDRALA